MNMKEVIKKYEEFKTFLETIDIEDLKNTYSRQELQAFQEQLKTISLPQLSWEIGKLLKEMKEEEFPQLKSVYRYPELNEIDFMTEKKKVELDKYLGMLKPGDYIFNLFRYTNQPQKLESYLKEKGIIGEVYHLTCSTHVHQKISSKLTLEEADKIKTAVIKKDSDYLEEALEGYYCSTCEDSPDYREWRDEYIQSAFVLAKERDKTLDKV